MSITPIKKSQDTTDIAMFVRTSNEEMDSFDKDRIVAALMKETGLPKDTAYIIADEVERQIKASGIKAITSSLIRELVNVRLVEMGLEEAHKLHSRLGMPLYDVERIIFHANKENANVPHNPEATNLTIAENIKKEYALNNLFSNDVTEAHMMGDIHLHDLGFIDRPYCSGQSLEYVKKFGLDLPNALSIAKPAKHADVLLAHLVKFTATLQCHIAGAIGWDAVNLFFAPYLVGMSDKELHQLAQMLIFEFSQQSVARGGQACFSDASIVWEVPKHFENVPAIGPGGKYTGNTYKEYETISQKFAYALFDVYMEGDGSGRPFFWPKPILHLSEKFFKTDGHKEFLNHVCHVASEKGSPYFVFDRGDTTRISQCCFDGDTKVFIKQNGKRNIIKFKDVIDDGNIEVYHQNYWKKASLVKILRDGKKMYEMSLSNNFKVISTEDHVWPTINNGDKRMDTLKKGDMLYGCDFFYDEKIDRVHYINGVSAHVIDAIRVIKDYKEDTVYCFEMEDQSEPYFTLPGGVITHNCRLQFKLEQSDLEDAKEPWKMRYCALQNVTINLPRIAYKAKGKDILLYKLLWEAMDTAAKAHRQKRTFIEELMAEGENGPLALLAMKRDGESYLRMWRATHLIGMLGLNELVQAHTGEQLHESDKAFKLGVKVISQMNLFAQQLGKQYGLKLILEQTPAESTTTRMARLDLKYYPEAAQRVVKGDLDAGEVYYTNSTLLNVSAPLGMIERVKKEGIFHPLIPAGSISHLWIGEQQPSAESLANFVTKVFRQTSNDQIAFSPEFTTCNACQRTCRGLHETCPVCGSDRVDGITRITGYFTKISSWNKGKLGELKDRHRHLGI